MDLILNAEMESLFTEFETIVSTLERAGIKPPQADLDYSANHCPPKISATLEEAAGNANIAKEYLAKAKNAKQYPASNGDEGLEFTKKQHVNSNNHVVTKIEKRIEGGANRMFTTTTTITYTSSNQEINNKVHPNCKATVTW